MGWYLKTLLVAWLMCLWCGVCVFWVCEFRFFSGQGSGCVLCCGLLLVVQVFVVVLLGVGSLVVVGWLV